MSSRIADLRVNTDDDDDDDDYYDDDDDMKNTEEYTLCPWCNGSQAKPSICSDKRSIFIAQWDKWGTSYSCSVLHPAQMTG